MQLKAQRLESKYIAAAAALSLFLATPCFAAQAPKPQAPPNPQQVNADVKAKATPDGSGMTGLDKDIAQSIRDMNAKVNKGLGDLKRQATDAKKKADDAAKAAEKARDAGTNCKDEKDKKKLDDLIADAEKKQKDAQDAKDKRDQTLKDMNKQVDDTAKAVEDYEKNLQNQLSQARDTVLANAKAAGLKETDWSVKNQLDSIDATSQALGKAINKANQEGEWKNGKYDATNEGMKAKLDSAAVKAREAIRRYGNQTDKQADALDPNESLKNAADFIKAAKGYADNCPPKVGMAPQKHTGEATAFMNNAQGSTVCTYNADDAKKLDGDVIADGPAGTVSTVKDDPQTVARKAKEKGVNTCWIEVNYCVIFTPLTAFRGHDHEAHVHSGRAQHDHDAPDPPWAWGVKPPETVIRWEAK